MVAVCEKILVENPYHFAVAYAALYVLFLSVSLQPLCTLLLTAALITLLHHSSLFHSLNELQMLQLSLCLIKKPATVIYAVKAHAVVVVSVMLGAVVLLLYKVISGGDLVLQVGVYLTMHGAFVKHRHPAHMCHVYCLTPQSLKQALQQHTHLRNMFSHRHSLQLTLVAYHVDDMHFTCKCTCT